MIRQVLVGLMLLLTAITTQCFAPAHRYLGSNRLSLQRQVFETEGSYQSTIDSCNAILTKAAVTKDEDPDQVFEALSSLEKLMREKCKAESDASQSVLDNLNGSWRLIFSTFSRTVWHVTLHCWFPNVTWVLSSCSDILTHTCLCLPVLQATGTAKSQERLGARINYFPFKAIQAFDTNTWAISNAIYIGEFPVIQFFGDFDFNLKSRKLEFDFDTISIFGFKINLGKGQAAQIGASSGLGSDSNVVNAKRDRKAFFNWIAADESIATARGGGGGLALWKRVEVVEEDE